MMMVISIILHIPAEKLTQFSRPLRSCQRDRRQRMDIGENEESSLLDALKKDLNEDMNDKAGSSEFEPVFVKSADEHQLSSTKEFAHLKESLRLFSFSPKPPAMAEHGFPLSKKGGNLIREAFEDDWQAASLNYAAVAENATSVLKAVKVGEIESDSPIVKASTNALLTAHDVLARSMQQCKHLARKQANKESQRPGTERTRIASEEEARALQSEIDTKQKLERTLKPKPFGRGFGHRGNRNEKKWWNRRCQGPRNSDRGGTTGSGGRDQGGQRNRPPQ